MNFIDLWWSFALIIIGSYLLGSMNNAIILSKFMGKDIRKLGSGNPGTMNVSRTLGLKAAVLVLFLDILKGVIPTLIATFAFGDSLFEASTLPVSVMAKYMAGFFAVLGHIFPCYYRFKGGKGIATTIGVFLVCNPLFGIIFAIVALLFILVTGIGSMGSFLGTTPPAIIASMNIYRDYLVKEPVMEFKIAYLIFVNAFIMGIVVLTWIAHRQNIKRLLSGDEHPTEWLQMIKDISLKKRIKKQKEEEAKKANKDGENLSLPQDVVENSDNSNNLDGENLPQSQQNLDNETTAETAENVAQTASENAEENDTQTASETAEEKVETISCDA